ncbi:protein NO VEIN domain-containing protein [Hymenobacter crusticola]|uniref:Protein NO VEIN C-terminal domain-containing protein n=1 Tax=Hymenobacter crusticola TaxID=1770526 RepID=A0A243W6H7_9BACT|nr:DUF3883 domain-containing protein [Hymenobacter crusticola]OUJ69931.1 hypothetical protein BXP70_25660 [Hymenobacter crusticola]
MQPIIFFNTGWMNRYAGPNNDSIQGGGKYVQVHKTGGEMFNFKPHRGMLYGYVQPPRGGNIHINRLGAGLSVSSISNVLVVWTATHPVTRGTFVVGWYKSATVYAAYHKVNVTRTSQWNWQGRKHGYHATAKSQNAVLLLPDARTLAVPRGKGNMGQSNVWYADKNPAFEQEVRDYIQHYQATGRPPLPIKRAHGRRQPDVLKRQAVERKAVEVVSKYYSDYGYTVDSVEKDNVGWDLEARSGNLLLKLEVKGLSGRDVVVDLTPNEYRQMKADPAHYRLCVVTRALDKPTRHIFSYLPGLDQWQDELGQELQLDEVVSARAALKH